MVMNLLPKAPLKPQSCVPCPLHAIGGPTWSSPEGSGSRRVLLLGEALGGHEAIDGLPFRPYADAGSELERAIKRCGWDRSQFILWNLVGCRPPGNHLDGALYERRAISSCREHLDRVIEQYQPRAILSLGRLPTRELTGLWGEKQGIGMVRGFICDNLLYPGIPVIPTYHPSYIARGGGIQSEEGPQEKKKSGVNPKHLRGTLIRDLQLAVKVAAEGFTRPEERYQTFPPREVVEEFIQMVSYHPEWIIFTDIETIESSTLEGEDEVERFNLPITQIQFTVLPGHSIVLPWEQPFISLAMKVLSLPNPKAGWNFWGFDLPVMRANHVRIFGKTIDSMAAWHHWQPDLPQGLQYATSFAVIGAVPWKHLHQADKGLYGGRDSNFNLLTHQWILKQLSSKGLDGTYIRHVEDFHPILVRASERGIPVSEENLTILGSKLEVEKDLHCSRMQEIHPDVLKNVSPPNGYVREPQDTTGMIRREFEVEAPIRVTCSSCLGLGFHERQEARTLKSGKLSLRTKKEKCSPCKGKGLLIQGKEPIKEERWCNLELFKPSSQQVVRYLNHKKEEEERDLPKYKRVYYIPKVRERDGRERETSAEEEIRKLWLKTKRASREDPLLGEILRYREIEKLLGTYVKSWHPSGDGRVHTTFRFTAASGQLAAVRPNVLTIPKRKDIAEEFRSTIEAAPGCVLIELDWNAFHAKTLGFEAKDPDYMRIASSDIHSFVACHMLNLPEKDRLISLPDEELRSILKYYRSSDKLYGGKTFEEIRGNKAKPSILGIGFGLGVEKLYRMNEESFSSLSEAKSVKDLLRFLFPKIFAFQKDICLKAYNQGHLQTLHGYIRWFWDVYYWDHKTRGMKNGSEAEAAMAFNPSNDAHGMLRENLISLEGKDLLEKYGFILPYHDALWFHCRKSLAEECIVTVKNQMEAPSSILIDPEVAPNGFTCSVDVKMGANLGKSSMKGWRG